jgi:hypothetical protein
MTMVEIQAGQDIDQYAASFCRHARLICQPGTADGCAV